MFIQSQVLARLTINTYKKREEQKAYGLVTALKISIIKEKDEVYLI